MSREGAMTKEDLVAKTPLEPFTELGATYNCLKTLLWLVWRLEAPRTHKMMGHILAIAEQLQELEGLDEEKEGEDDNGE